MKKNNFISRFWISSMILLSASSITWAQQSFGGEPLSFGSESAVATSALRSTTGTQKIHIVTPDFNEEDLLARNNWETSRQAKPFYVGQVMPCDFSFARDAQKVATIDGKEIYRLVVSSEGTPRGINLYYDQFSIPQGGKLYIYTPSRDQVLGAYTHDTHPSAGSFATEPLSGSELILEYEKPVEAEMPTIEISGMGYLYVPVFKVKSGYGDAEDRSDMYPSLGCQININCSEGEAWQTEKAGVVSYMARFDGGQMGFCSGDLVMTTAKDFQPYILTAGHCAGEENPKGKPTEGLWKGEFGVSQNSLNQWIFAFHYEKPHCSNGEHAAQYAKTMTGCSMKSYLSIYGKSDGMLLLLNDQIPDNYRVYYNGWDRTATVWQEVTGIHHPAGDAKKISIKNTPSGTYIGGWPSNGGDPKGYFVFDYTAGATEGGSSGSALFNKDKRQVGTLTGGSVAVCAGDNVYGRLNAHWDRYKDEGDKKSFYRMDTFLDAGNLGYETVDGSWKNNYKPLLHLSQKSAQAYITADGKNIEVVWEALPVHDQGYKITYAFYKDGKFVRESEELKYNEPLTEELQNKGVVNYKVQAKYDVNGSPIYTAPVYLNVYTGSLLKEVAARTKSVSSGIEVSWRKVQNLQTIDRLMAYPGGSFLQVRVPALQEKFTAWIMSAWPTDRFNINDENYISQINFMPSTPGEKVTLVIKQKKRNYYTEVVNIPEDASTKKYYTHTLVRPFLIDPNELLYVGYQVSTDSSHPIRTFVPGANEKDDDYSQYAFKVFLHTTEYGIVNLEDHSYLVKNAGYLPIQLVISNSKDKLAHPAGRTSVTSPIPGKFPEVKKYIIYKNGQVFKEVDANTLYIIDDKGTTNDTYTVSVDYGAGVSVQEVETPENAPRVFPAVFSNELMVANPSAIQSIKMYSITGEVVASVPYEKIESILSTANLAPGQYVVKIETIDGRTYTQKVIKK